MKCFTAIQATLRYFKRWFFHHFHFALLLCLLTSDIGYSSFIVAPSNYSTCLGSNATFSCVVNLTATLEWTMNGQFTTAYNITSPAVSPLTPAGIRSTLIIPGDYELDGITIVCSYTAFQSAPVYSMSAILTVQGPTVNLTSISLNTTFFKLSWAFLKPKMLQSEVLNIVNIGNANGSVSSISVLYPEVIIAIPDLCTQYTATIVPQCLSTNSVHLSVQALTGTSPQQISEEMITLIFTSSPTVNVSINILQPGVCYYTVVAAAGTEVFKFLRMKALSPLEGWSTIVVPLPQNKHFTLTITASNVFGEVNTTYAISTFDVLDVYMNTSFGGALCSFHNGSLAIGCLLVLTNAANRTEAYTMIIKRFSSSPLNLIPCQTYSSYGALSVEVFIVEAFDIELDGTTSSLPAVVKNMTFCNPSIDSPVSSSTATKFQAPSVLAANTCKVAAVGSSISTAVGVSVSVTFVVSFSVGVLVASVFCYISRKSKMSADTYRPHASHITVYDEVCTNKKMRCDVMEMNENTAYGYHVTQNH